MYQRRGKKPLEKAIMDGVRIHGECAATSGRMDFERTHYCIHPPGRKIHA